MTYNAIYAVFFSLIAHRALYHPAVQKMAVGDRHAFAGARRADHHRCSSRAVCRHAVQLGVNQAFIAAIPDRDRLFDQQHGGDLRPHPRYIALYRKRTCTTISAQRHHARRWRVPSTRRVRRSSLRSSLFGGETIRGFIFSFAVRRSDRYPTASWFHHHSALVRSDARVDQEQGSRK